MKVKDLIALFAQCDQEAEAYVWDAYADCESKAIRVSVTKDWHVHVDVNVFGREMTVGTPRAAQRSR
jgi:hypothetical protein